VTKDRAAKRITVDYVEGPLKYLKNEWRFDAAENGGSTVFFSVDFAFRSRLFETIAGAVFDRALRKMTGAFEARAAVLYGVPALSSGNTASA
jgi:coenzyme Q-binding protein COQ10